MERHDFEGQKMSKPIAHSAFSVHRDINARSKIFDVLPKYVSTIQKLLKHLAAGNPALGVIAKNDLVCLERPSRFYF